MQDKKERIKNVSEMLQCIKDDKTKLMIGYDNFDEFRCFYLVIDNDICAEIFISRNEYRVWSFDQTKDEKENSILCEDKALSKKYGPSIKENKWVFVEQYSNQGFKYVKNFIDEEQLLNTLKALKNNHSKYTTKRININNYSRTKNGNYKEI